MYRIDGRPKSTESDGGRLPAKVHSPTGNQRRNSFTRRSRPYQPTIDWQAIADDFYEGDVEKAMRVTVNAQLMKEYTR